MVFPELLLASASPRRRDLLREHGFSFIVQPPDIEEVAPDYLTTSETVLLNAKRKAASLANECGEDRVIVGVDTLVCCDGKTLGKPASRGEAFDMIRCLSGRSHEVVSGVWLLRPPARYYGFLEMSRVTFRSMSFDEIRKYHDVVKPFDKAGAYAAQEDPFGLIESIEGSRTNVIGIPIERFCEVMRKFQVSSSGTPGK
jgi:septum formation protein